MDLGSILFILALFFLVVLFISRPLFESKTPLSSEYVSPNSNHDVSQLLAERDQIIESLRELEFDHSIGKIPEENYPKYRVAMLERGAKILSELDVVLDQSQPDSLEERELDERLEIMIAAQKRGVILDGTTPDDELEIMIANRKRSRQAKSAGFCSKCGSPVQTSDKFCPKCGATIHG